MGYRDLREWVQQVDEMGELLRIDGADWNLEIGALAEVAGRGPTSQAILFDQIKDYPAGYRAGVCFQRLRGIPAVPVLRG